MSVTSPSNQERTKSMSALLLPAQPVDATLCLKEKRRSVTMDQGFRRGFTAAEKTELWDRWKCPHKYATSQ